MKLPDNISKALMLLSQKGHEAFCIGGCVRDSIMGIEPNDYDITTSADPNEILDCFSAYKCLTVGIRHGTVTVMIDDDPLEITTFRIDGEYIDSRHPESVTFTKDLYEDTARRDFTVNAIAYSPAKGYIDQHNGIKDIEDKIIRCVGDPVKRFTEDALRILRALRFASVLGFDIETDTCKAIHEKKHLLKDIAKERIFTEFTKLICGTDAKRILLEFHDVIEIFIPEIAPMVGFEQNNPHHCYDVYIHTLTALEAVRKDPVLRWTMLLHDIGKPHCYTEDERGGHFYGHYKISAQTASKVLKDLRASKNFTDTVTTLVYKHDALIPMTEKSVKKLLMRLGADNTMLLFEVNRADAMGQAKHQIRERIERSYLLEKKAKEILEAKECFSLKNMNIKGNDLTALGIPKGKQIGIILNTLLEEITEDTLENEGEILKNRALELYRSM